MKRFIFLLAFIATTITSFAYDVEVDGLFYNLNPTARTAEVTSELSEYPFYISYPTGAVVIPEKITVQDVKYSVEYIRSRAFNYCWGMTSVTIPNSVKAIGDHAFSECGIESVTLPNSLTELKRGTFYDCGSLTSVVIPNSVYCIEDWTFAYCRSLKSVDFSNSLTRIEDHAFYGCSALTSVDIPHSVEVIGESAFRDCSSMTSAILPNSLTNIITGTFQGCSSLESVTIPNVTYICSWSFADCESLKSVTIPNSVKTIENDAFDGCKRLRYVTLGNGIGELAARCFADCKSLEQVVCYAEKLPFLGNNVFQGSPVYYSALYVPDDSVKAYKEADQWKEFAVIKGIVASAVNGIEVDTNNNTTLFNLSGKPLQQPQTGINIINGKKVLKN